MKNLFLFALIVLASMAGCKKIDQLTQFNLDYKVAVVIPSATGINLPFNIFTPDVKTDSESKFAVNDTRKDMVKEIKLTTLNLTLTAPANGNLGFLKSIEIFITAEGLTEQKIAWKQNIPSGTGKYIDLETASIDLKEFIMKDEFTLRLSTVTDEILTSDHHIDVNASFFVDAKILGF